MRSSTAVGLAAARGRLTSMPRYIIGAVSMKMRSSTRTTSTRGMMLISASVAPTRREPPESVLKAIFAQPRGLARPREQVQEIQRKAFHLGGPVLHAIHEVVVADDGGNRRSQAKGGGNQGFGDARRDYREGRRALLPDAMEGRHDAPHGAEQPDERR